MTDVQPDAAVFTWDWREPPDMEQLASILHDVSGGNVHLRMVETGSDQYAAVISTVDLGDAAAQATYERWYEGGQGVGEVRRG